MKKTFFKRALVVLLAAVMMFTLAACSGGGEEEEDAAKETYVVVTEPTFPPFDTTNDKDELDGFDMDMVKAIAKDQGFEVEFKSMEFASLIPALEAGNADIIAAGMNAEDEERREKVDFTDTYYDSGLVVMVRNDETRIDGEDSLDSTMSVASQTGTTGADEATSLEEGGKIKKAVILDGFDTCIMQLKNKDVDAIIIDKPVAENYMTKHEGDFKLVGEVLNAESYGMAVKKGNTELLEKLNQGLKDIVESGEFKEICEKWNIDSKFDK